MFRLRHSAKFASSNSWMLDAICNGRGNMFRLRRSAKMAPMAEKWAKAPRRLPRRSHIHLSRHDSAGASPAGGRSAPAGETHSPALSPCVARSELQSARFASASRQGGGLSACRNGVIAQRDGAHRISSCIEMSERRGRRRMSIGEANNTCVPFNGVTKPERPPPCPSSFYLV